MSDTPGPGDKWAVDDGSYSPRNFYTTSSDGHGHSDTLYSKISPYVRGQLSQIVEQRLIPEYGTVGALIRDAIAHRLKQVATEFGNVKVDYLANQILMYEHQLARAERRQREAKMTEQFVENIQMASTPEEKEEVIEEARIAIDAGMILSPYNISKVKPYF